MNYKSDFPFKELASRIRSCTFGPEMTLEKWGPLGSSVPVNLCNLYFTEEEQIRKGAIWLTMNGYPDLARRIEEEYEELCQQCKKLDSYCDHKYSNSYKNTMRCFEEEAKGYAANLAELLEEIDRKVAGVKPSPKKKRGRPSKTGDSDPRLDTMILKAWRKEYKSGKCETKAKFSRQVPEAIKQKFPSGCATDPKRLLMFIKAAIDRARKRERLRKQ